MARVEKGATAAALVAGKPFPRRRLAGDAQSGVPVAGLDSGLALGLARGMRSPLGFRAGLYRGSTVLPRTRRGGAVACAAAELRRTAFQSPECPMCHNSNANRERKTGWCSPCKEPGWRGVAGKPAMRLRGEGGAELAEESMQGVSGPSGPSIWFGRGL